MRRHNQSLCLELHKLAVARRETERFVSIVARRADYNSPERHLRELLAQQFSDLVPCEQVLIVEALDHLAQLGAVLMTLFFEL